MDNTRQIIDYAYNDQGTELRSALYAEIHDRVMSHFEAKKMEIARNLITQEEKEEDEDEGHEDEAEDKKMMKKMIKKELAKEEIDDEDEWEEEEEEEDDEDLTLEDFSVEELLDFMVTEEYAQLDEQSKTTLRDYIKYNK